MKTAIITGASRGIGAEISKVLAKNGYFTVINYCNSEKEAQSVLNSIISNGGQGMLFRADVSNYNECKKLIQSAYNETGSVDLLVNNAGISISGLIQDYTEEKISKILSVNLSSVIYCTSIASDYMIKNHEGNIINISSMWGIRGASCESVYSASKAGVIGFTKSVACELAPSGIRVNCVCPGVIDTDMNSCYSKETMDELANETPLGRIGKVSDIAKAVSFLASDDSSFITGQCITVDGGFTV